MMNKSVRVPKSLLDEIDQYVGGDKFYSSRSDFVLSGMRQLIDIYVQKWRELLELYNVPKSKETLEQAFYSITMLYLDAFNKYDGKTTQINIRTPNGLGKQISLFLKNEYGYSKIADFPRAAIVCLLSHLKDTNDLLFETEKFIEEQEKLRQDAYNMVIEGLKNNLSGPELINDTYQRLLEKHAKKR